MAYFREGWQDELLDDVHITTVGNVDDSDLRHSLNHERIQWHKEEQDNLSVPWPWFPNLGRIGVGDSLNPRAWFMGRPQGQEVSQFLEDILTVSRHRRGLSPLTESMIQGLNREVHVVVLLTAG